MTPEQVKDAAQEVRDWLENAVGDVAYSYGGDPHDLFHDYFGDRAEAKLREAEQNGVTDFVGWMADELYNDVDTLMDLSGDRIYDAGSGNEPDMIAIAQEIRASAHSALQTAMDRHIARWEERMRS